MNAFRPAPVRSVESPRPRRPRRRSSSKVRGDRVAIWETSLKLAADVTVSFVAVAALVRLVPSHLTSRVELQKLEAEVETTEQRVEVLQAEFGRYFDPQQTKVLMQEESQLVDPHQRRVVWTEPRTEPPNL
ncbi:hypothetical protein CKA32_004474 [Geitlerinema sp. FC II]|nr:hypothetical protein CKA32_004474 [Geitlerinema sp. FC II]